MTVVVVKARPCAAGDAALPSSLNCGRRSRAANFRAPLQTWLDSQTATACSNRLAWSRRAPAPSSGTRRRTVRRSPCCTCRPLIGLFRRAVHRPLSPPPDPGPGWRRSLSWRWRWAACWCSATWACRCTPACRRPGRQLVLPRCPRHCCMCAAVMSGDGQLVSPTAGGIMTRAGGLAGPAPRASRADPSRLGPRRDRRCGRGPGGGRAVRGPAARPGRRARRDWRLPAAVRHPVSDVDPAVPELFLRYQRAPTPRSATSPCSCWCPRSAMAAPR